MRKKFYLTTPIYYVNDTPHIGHTVTTVAADIVARYYRQKNYQVFFLTGTDEHGAYVAEAAEKHNLTPQKYCDQMSKKFKNAWEKLKISNDFFIRTSDPQHEKVVKEFIQRIYQAGDIYRGKYEGPYCIGCEKFLTEIDLVKGRCPFHPNKKIIYAKEDNYFFQLSKYVPQLIRLIKNKKTNYIFPESKRKEILTKLESGVTDISISREKVKWGIPFPANPKHTIYVWVDALLNYYSATQFVKNKEKFWPADLHLIAKDILWFHTVIWPAMLMAAKLPLPKKVYAHCFYTIAGQKMSKSLGNVISPEQLIENFGVDGARYLIASSFPGENDTDISLEKFKEKYNADLANGLGNLISRIAKLAAKEKLILDLKPKKHFFPKISKHIEALEIPEALFEIWNDKTKGVYAINKFFNENKIWEKKGRELKKHLEEITTLLLNIAYNLKPFMPEAADRIENIFQSNKLIKPPKVPLFPRLTGK